MFTPRVIDIYRGTKIESDSFEQAKAAGIWGIIHKASEGVTYKDATYQTRRQMIADAGLLFGAYHFNRGNDWKGQVDNFIESAQPDRNTLMVLDFEESVYQTRTGDTMSIQSAVAFMKELEQITGQPVAIYSGNRLKETVAKLSKADQDYMVTKKLWLAQYGPRAVLPKGFSKYFLWQYTGDGIGPQPHTVGGFENGIDLNVFDGDQATLTAQWAV